jgi:hypothetical protein
MSVDWFDALWDLRKQLWLNGYRPVAIRTYPEALKFPTNEKWQIEARQDPPHPAVSREPDSWFRSTGILADGLQAIDIDLRDPKACSAVYEWCQAEFGPAPIRHRANSPRKLLLYRAAEGAPSKARAWEKGVDGQAGQGVEILGYGNQFMAYGTHPSGAELEWIDGPDFIPADELTAISIEQVTALREWVTARFLDVQRAVSSGARTNDGAIPEAVERPYSGLQERWPNDDIQAALDAIPNCTRDYDWWFTIIAAVYVASHGEGYSLFSAWSAGNPAHSERLCRQTWNALTCNPPAMITGRTLIRNAQDANGGYWSRPSKRLSSLPSFYQGGSSDNDDI